MTNVPKGHRLTLERVTHRFGDVAAVEGIELDIAGGELVALLGPSGCGKSTLLRIIAGFVAQSEGRVLFDGEAVDHLAPTRRGVGIVFQNYALFPHMTVAQNVAYGLEARRLPKDAIGSRVEQMLCLVHMETYAQRLPRQLSGGQQQRIALARALAVDPKILLLDEPFGALDAQVRAELRAWLRRLHDEIHLTTVFVTHDQDEAFEVADRVVVMNHGKVEQVGSPTEVFEHPANDFVMRFLGHVNVLEAQFEAGRARVGSTTVAVANTGERAAGRVYVRPHEVEIGRAPAENAVPATVVRITPLGSGLKIELAVPALGQPMRADVDWERGSALALRDGDEVFVSLRRARVFAEAA
jgi:sulfate transport system ATP-binding protein